MSAGPLSRQRGFTLLELLVAFTIAASAITAILYAFAGGLWRLQRTADFGVAALVAESRLAELGVSTPLQPGVSSGGNESGDYDWTITVEPYQHESLQWTDAGYHLYAVTVQVVWERGGRDNRFFLYSLKAAPGHE